MFTRCQIILEKEENEFTAIKAEALKIAHE